MTEHLPECFASRVEPTSYVCICSALRACEQRVVVKREGNGELWLDGYGTGYADGEANALAAARDAMADLHGAYPTTNGRPPYTMSALEHDSMDAVLRQALAAIDTLRGV